MLKVRPDIFFAVFVLAPTLGCGSGGTTTAGTTPDASIPTADISGWYQVTSDLEGACGSPKPFSLAPAYLWVERRQNTFYIRPCSGTATADCTGTLFYDFTQPIENGWAAEGGTAFYSAGCTLSWERDQATLAGSQLNVKSLRYKINQDIPQSECVLASASALAQPCTYEVDLAATRL
jgi:hypothetical protein